MDQVAPQPFGDELGATAEWTREWRRMQRWTQERLAEALGYDVSYLAKIEQGRRRPTEQFVARLSEVTETPKAHILRLVRRPSAETRLPVPNAPLVGRAQEVAHLCHLMTAQARFVSLVGVPGIGKSALALEVAWRLAERFRDGAFLVALADLDRSAKLSSAVVHGLGLVEQGGRDSGLTVIEALRRRELLLVLDDCDRVPDGRAFLERLLGCCPHLRILVTSSAPLGLPSETEFRVPPLAVPHAVRDFVDDARAYPAVMAFVAARRRVQPSFVLDDGNAGAVVDICARLGGMPFAITLMASVTSLSPADLAKRVRALLDDGTSGALHPGPAPGLGPVLEWTRGALPPGHRQALDCLAVFSGGCSLRALEAMCGGRPADVLVSLAGLESRSLIVATPTPDGDSRFRCPEVLRRHTLEHLRTDGSLDALRERHCRYYVELAAQAEPTTMGGEDQVRSLRSLEADHANLATAFEWALAHDPERALRLGAALWRFYSMARVSEGRRLIASAVQVAGGSAVDRIRCFIGLGVLARSQGHLHCAAASFRHAAALAFDVDATPELALALLNQGILAAAEGAHATAQERFDDALALYRRIGDSRGIGHVENCLGVLAYRQGDHLGASGAFLAAIARFRALDDIGGVAVNASNLGWIAEADGQLTEARQWYEEALQIWEHADDRHGRAWAMADLGRLARRRGDVAQARHLVATALRGFESLGDRQLAGACALELEAIPPQRLRRDGARRLFAPTGARGTEGREKRTHGEACVLGLLGGSVREVVDSDSARGAEGAASGALSMSRSDVTGLSVRTGLPDYRRNRLTQPS